MVSQSREIRQGAILCESPDWFKRVQTGGIWRCPVPSSCRAMPDFVSLSLVCGLPLSPTWTWRIDRVAPTSIYTHNYWIYRIIFQYCLYDNIRILNMISMSRLQEISDYARCLCRLSVDSSALQSFAASRMKMHRKCIVIPVLGQCEAMQTGDHRWISLVASVLWRSRRQLKRQCKTRTKRMVSDTDHHIWLIVRGKLNICRRLTHVHRMVPLCHSWHYIGMQLPALEAKRTVS